MASMEFQVPSAPKRCRLDLGLAAAATSMTTPTAGGDDNVSLLEDVIFEILSWLPAKSLCRYRCVSKNWRALICNPGFVTVHRFRAEPLLVAMSCSGDGPSFLQMMDVQGNVVKVVKYPGCVQSFCLSIGRLLDPNFGHKFSNIRVIHLDTGKKFRTCQKPAKKERDVDASRSTRIERCFGFGSTAKSGVRKIFGVVLQLVITGIYQCEVLSLGKGAKWRPTRPPPYSISAVYDDYSEGVTLNGYVYFLSLDEESVLLISFDLESEEWKVIQGPSGVLSHAAMEKISIAELNGSVCLVQNMGFMICLWLLTDPSKQTWIKIYSIRMGYKPIHLLTPLRMIHPSGKLLFCYFYNKTSGPELQIYDPRSGGCTDVKNAPTNLVGNIRLCSTNVDPRFSVEL
ncbi:hypothetical protein QYE76_069926 [Lolium multiflorum]|uniref:F-box domain-containing protein n=1 Tax=Lolium multiflorum TaxID=4521 RepID=A0AAD8SIP7_LOLMU|nr:hypothetical protein QYE76_069926 [Lolium multiflorum]